MSPEQAQGRPDLIDERTDVYQLGAMLFEILTNRPPHRMTDHPRKSGEVPLSTLGIEGLYQKIAEQPTPSVRDVDPKVPPSLDRICARAMAFLMDDRYSSVTALAAAVRGWLDESPLETYRAAVDYFAKLVDQNPRMRSYREGLARNLTNLGLMLAGMDRQDAAVKAFRGALADYEGLADQHPKVLSYRADLAGCRLHLRNSLLAVGRETEAEECSRGAIAEYQKLLHTRPEDPRYISQVASILHVIGQSPNVIEQTLGPATPDEPHEEDSRAGSLGDSISNPTDSGAPQRAASDRNLMLLALALERGFLCREDFAKCIKVWRDNPDAVVGETLVAARLLSNEQRAVLEAAVDRHAIVPGQHGTAGRVSESSSSLTGNMTNDISLLPRDDKVSDMLSDIVNTSLFAPRGNDSEFATLAPQAFGDHPPPEGRFSDITTAPRYRIQRILGRGGMGEVVLAVDESLDRLVAIKSMLRDSRVDTTHFLREARVSATLEHPGIVPVYSYGTAPSGRSFIVMRYVKGRTLYQCLQEYHANLGVPNSPLKKWCFWRNRAVSGEGVWVGGSRA